MKFALRTRILVVIAGAVAVYVLWSPADSPTVEPVKEGSAARQGPQLLRSASQDGSRALYRLAHRVIDASASGSLFAAHSWYSPPPAPVPVVSIAEAAAASRAAAAARVPTAPPLPFAFMGSYTPEGAAPVIFLTEGDRVYDVHVGDTVDNNYTVDGIEDGQIVMTYKPLQIKQQLAVGGVP